MRLLAARRLVLLVTLAVPSFAPPQQIELRIKGTLGESYDVQTSVQIELAASAVDTPDQIEMQLRVRTRAVQRFEVLDVRFNGNVRFLTTGLRVQSEIRINGQTAFAFDSDNPGGREFAAANPQAVQLLALLDAEVEIEQDPSGRILDYVASGAGAEITAQAETHFEEAVARDAVILPSGPVEIGASWQGGAREFRFPGFGAVSYPLIVTLTAIESLNGEQVAMLSLRAGEPTYTAAAGAQTGVQVESFGLDGEIRF